MCDLNGLGLQGQPMNFYHVVKHTGKNSHNLPKLLPIKGRFGREWIFYKSGQIDRTQQTGSMRWQGLFTTRIGGTHFLTKPVVVHLIDLVDENKTRLGVVKVGTHDQVP